MIYTPVLIVSRLITITNTVFWCHGGLVGFVTRFSGSGPELRRIKLSDTLYKLWRNYAG